MIKRKKTKKIYIGSVPVGGNSPIIVQSMTNTKTEDFQKTAKQIIQLENVGCEIIRVAVPNKEAATAIRHIKKKISIPIIADIHFDYKLAIESIKSGVDALRFNPGNIGSKQKIKILIDYAKEYSTPIRIGVNAGSLEKEIINKYKGPSAKGMVESALKQVRFLQELNFNNIKISVKASNPSMTIEAYRILSTKTDFPLHIGVTEAGSLYPGIVKSSIGIGTLLSEGIGDTIRVSLTENPIKEVMIGFEILKALSIRQKGPEIISCPTCGRCEVDLFQIVDRVKEITSNMTSYIKIAIMGCIVNGPGEAKNADIGIAISKEKAIFFKKGKIIKKIPANQIIRLLTVELNKFNS